MLEIIKIFLSVIGILFVLYLLGYASFLMLSVISGSLKLYREKRKQKYHNTIEHEYYVPVSILVPAYNEEVTVVDTVKSMLDMDYKLYEIVVVDDGSSDNTTPVLLNAFDMKQVERPINRSIDCQRETEVYETVINNIAITLVRKINGGKADALNMGICASKYPYFICMDADSILQKDSLKNIILPIMDMDEDEIVAVGGMVRISNSAVIKDGQLVEYHMPWNPVVSTQILEYDRSFMASRILMDQFNGNLIISGAFGLFQKDAVINVGGYDPHTLGEDMELVVKLHAFCKINKIPYSIRYATDAVCWSQCPSNIGDLRKQRRRWHLGLYQCLKKYKRMFLAPEFGVVGYISYLYYLIYELLSPFIEIFGILTVILAFAANLINLPFMILFFIVYAAYGAILTLTAFFARIYTQNIKLSLLDTLKAVVACILEACFFRFIQLFTRMTAFFGYKSRKNVWGKIKRHKINLEQTNIEMEVSDDKKENI